MFDRFETAINLQPNLLAQYSNNNTYQYFILYRLLKMLEAVYYINDLKLALNVLITLILLFSEI